MLEEGSTLGRAAGTGGGGPRAGALGMSSGEGIKGGVLIPVKEVSRGEVTGDTSEEDLSSLGLFLVRGRGVGAAEGSAGVGCSVAAVRLSSL